MREFSLENVSKLHGIPMESCPTKISHILLELERFKEIVISYVRREDVPETYIT